MGDLFSRYSGQILQGKDITISTSPNTIFISERDKVFCYAGVCLDKETSTQRRIFSFPHYMDNHHSTEKSVAEEICGFYRISDGCIYLDEYIDSPIYGDMLYKKINAGCRLPGPDTYYGIMSDYNEDEDLTRAVFGLACYELNTLLEAYAKVFGIYVSFSQYPRLTRSLQSSNSCDLTGLWIPERFPYIAFNDSGYAFSHISLFGFYRHIQLLTGCRLTSVASQALLRNGIDEELLKRVFVLGETCWYQEKVTYLV